MDQITSVAALLRYVIGVIWLFNTYGWVCDQQRRCPMTVYVAVDFMLVNKPSVTVTWPMERYIDSSCSIKVTRCARFYAGLTGEVIVGFEASGYSAWFEQMLAELGHTYWLGQSGRDQTQGATSTEERPARCRPDAGLDAEG
jgi:hypothetical protein